ncbi:STAS-like domain-containing protein [Caviibacter abscessus]|uniref:STAS-like domain-containing protein n=1 Tax=Caviibacter abscessus TaxID=1766719 RepID=UPI000838B332|nr:STAS-like domain-containing protein [Caviibacter abscessus]
MKIIVKYLINTKFAIKERKANILFEKIIECLQTNEIVVLDFQGISATTTRFFNLSIGKLYENYPHSQIDNIQIENANNFTKKQYEVAVYGAKNYYKNKFQ